MTDAELQEQQTPTPEEIEASGVGILPWFSWKTDFDEEDEALQEVVRIRERRKTEMSKPRIEAIPNEQDENGYEYVLRAHHPNGSHAGIGVCNGKLEAELVAKTINEAIGESFHVESRWLEYLS